jgi:co-chaperonin GroES (HSP10)
MKFHAYADNVLLELLPHETQTSSGIHLARLSADRPTEHRKARVLATGPGRYTRLGALVPNGVAPGDIVIVSATCGDKANWSSFDVGDAPRANEENARVSAIDGERGTFRVVRAEEILAVVETEAQAAE